MTDLTSKTRAELREIIAAAKAEIDAAYWTFTRTARGKPPCLVVPDAYKRRSAAKAELARRREERCTTTTEPPTTLDP